MKIKNIYKLFALLLVLFVLSFSSGPGAGNQQVTGAPGSSGNQGTCGNCHVEGSFAPSASIELLDGMDEVTAYQPGKSYTLRITITESSGSPNGYGFQTVTLDAGDSQAGSWGDIGSGKQISPISNRDYLEHDSSSDSGTFEAEWIAPDAGAGEVTFYTAGIAANGNGTTAGDGVASASLSIGEDPANSTSDLNGQEASLTVLPNPVHEMLNLQINSRITGDFNVRIIDVMGKVVQAAPVNVQHGEQVAQIPVNDLLSGLYVVQLCGEGHLAAVQMLKN